MKIKSEKNCYSKKMTNRATTEGRAEAKHEDKVRGCLVGLGQTLPKVFLGDVCKTGMNDIHNLQL